MDGNQNNQVQVLSRHGGSRKGSGRKHMDLDTRWFAARGINPLTAGEILAKVRDERKLWERVLDSEDDRVLLQALMFLVSMRDGKPAQAINVTSTNINLNAGDVERARAIVAEIRGASSLNLTQSGPTIDQAVEGTSAHSGLHGLGSGDRGTLGG